MDSRGVRGCSLMSEIGAKSTILTIRYSCPFVSVRLRWLPPREVRTATCRSADQRFCYQCSIVKSRVNRGPRTVAVVSEGRLGVGGAYATLNPHPTRSAWVTLADQNFVENTGRMSFRQPHAEGLDGLVDRSSRPKSCPHQTSPKIEAQILELRRELKRGPARLAPLVGVPASTSYRVSRRLSIRSNASSIVDREVRE
jgi:hypothetical protein